MQDLFEDGLPQIQQVAKTEEELQMLSTAEDMCELERSLFLLRKGYLVQKSAVVFNLPRLCKEPEANEKLLPLVINSMSMWDIAMQTDCSKAFQEAKVIAHLSPMNREMLLMQVLEILGMTDLTLYDRFVEEWMLVLDLLLPTLEIHFINLTVFPHLKQLTGFNSDLQSRQVGFKMMCKIVLAHRLDAFESDLCYKRFVQQMSFDKSWRIRKQFSDFIQAFLEPLSEYRHQIERAQAEAISQQESEAKYPVSQKAMKTRRAFETIMKDVTLEILSDGDDQVAIEGISILAEFDFLFNRGNFEEELKPRLDDILANAIESRISVNQQGRLSRLQGLILHRLDRMGLLSEQLLEMLFRFFCICLKEPVSIQQDSGYPENDEIGTTVKEYYHNRLLDSQSVLLNAIYNLPCFYAVLGSRVHHPSNLGRKNDRLGSTQNSLNSSALSARQPRPQSRQKGSGTFRRNQTDADVSGCQGGEQEKTSSSKGSSQVVLFNKEIELMALELCQEDKPFEAKSMLALSYHELLKHKKDMQSFKRLDKLLDTLLQDPFMKDSGVQAALTQNLAHIISNYFAKISVKQVVDRILLQRRVRQTGLKTGKPFKRDHVRSLVETPNGKGPFKKDNSIPSVLPGKQDDSRNINQLNRSSSHREQLFQGADHLKQNEFLAEKLFSFVSIDAFPKDKLAEIGYSRLLDHLVLLFDKIIISQGGSRRDCERFLRNMAPLLHLFNPVEVQDYFVEKLDALITFSCDLVRGAVYCFLAHLISLQYRRNLRNQLIQKIKECVYIGSTIQQRKNFVLFCTESCKINTLERDGLFDKCFFPYLLKLGYNETNFSVHMALTKALPTVRDSIVASGDKETLKKLSLMVSEMKHAPNLHPEVFKLLYDTSANFKTDIENAKVAQMSQSEAQASRQKGLQHLLELEQREDFEIEAIKKDQKEQTAKKLVKRGRILKQLKAGGATLAKTRSLTGGQMSKAVVSPVELSPNQTVLSDEANEQDQCLSDTPVRNVEDLSSAEKSSQVNLASNPSVSRAKRPRTPSAGSPSQSKGREIIDAPCSETEMQANLALFKQSVAKLKASHQPRKPPTKSPINVPQENLQAAEDPQVRQATSVTSPLRKRLLKPQSDQVSQQNTTQQFMAKSNTRVETKRKVQQPPQAEVDSDDFVKLLKQMQAVPQDSSSATQSRRLVNKLQEQGVLTPRTGKVHQSRQEIALLKTRSQIQKIQAIGSKAEPPKDAPDESKEAKGKAKLGLTSPRVGQRKSSAGGLTQVLTAGQIQPECKKGARTTKKFNKDLQECGVPTQAVVDANRDEERKEIQKKNVSHGQPSPLKNSKLIAAIGRNKQPLKGSKTMQVTQINFNVAPSENNQAKLIANSNLNQFQEQTPKNQSMLVGRVKPNISATVNEADLFSKTQPLALRSDGIKPSNSQTVLFDHFNCSDPKGSVPRLEDRGKKTSVSIKLKGIIQSKKHSAGVQSQSSRLRNNVRKAIVSGKRSGRSSCNSSPSRTQQDSVFNQQVPRQSTPKKVKKLAATHVEFFNCSSPGQDFSEQVSTLVKKGSTSQKFTPHTAKTPNSNAMPSRQSPVAQRPKDRSNVNSKKRAPLHENDIIVFSNQDVVELRSPKHPADALEPSSHRVRSASKRAIYEPDEEPCNPASRFGEEMTYPPSQVFSEPARKEHERDILADSDHKVLFESKRGAPQSRPTPKFQLQTQPKRLPSAVSKTQSQNNLISYQHRRHTSEEASTFTLEQHSVIPNNTKTGRGFKGRTKHAALSPLEPVNFAKRVNSLVASDFSKPLQAETALRPNPMVSFTNLLSIEQHLNDQARSAKRPPAPGQKLQAEVPKTSYPIPHGEIKHQFVMRRGNSQEQSRFYPESASQKASDLDLPAPQMEKAWSMGTQSLTSPAHSAKSMLKTHQFSQRKTTLNQVMAQGQLNLSQSQKTVKASGTLSDKKRSEATVPTMGSQKRTSAILQNFASQAASISSAKPVTQKTAKAPTKKRIIEQAPGSPNQSATREIVNRQGPSKSFIQRQQTSKQQSKQPNSLKTVNLSQFNLLMTTPKTATASQSGLTGHYSTIVQGSSSQQLGPQVSRQVNQSEVMHSTAHGTALRMPNQNNASKHHQTTVFSPQTVSAKKSKKGKSGMAASGETPKQNQVVFQRRKSAVILGAQQDVKRSE